MPTRATSAASAAQASPLPTDKRRLTHLMLFRVGVVTLLLVSQLVAQWTGLDPAGVPAPQRSGALLGLTAILYGLTILYAMWLRAAERVDRLARVQLGTDLLLATVVVYLTGGADSAFAFIFLLLIIGAALVVEGGAPKATVAAISLYLAAALLPVLGLVPWMGESSDPLTLRELVRVLGTNVVAFAATGVLSSRLGVELQGASERLASQNMMLRDLAAVHQDVVRSLTSGLITLTEDDRVLTLNIAATQLLGVSDMAATGRPIDELLPELRPALDALAGTGAIRRGEVSHLRQDGAQRIFGISLSPLIGSANRHLGRVLNFQDLTELRQMEDAVRRAERLAAVGRLAAGVAHEIRNPLAAISGSIELLQKTAPLSDDVSGAQDGRELMAIVLREVNRLNGLITELLDFARPRRPQPQPIELGVTLTEILRVLTNDHQLKGARVELQVPEEVTVSADPGQLRQVVWNLIRNAAEASPGEVPVEVAIGREQTSAAEMGTISVRDHGPGIPAGDQGRVFEPFFSTKQGGTGLGLATVHRIVEENGGGITLECPPEGGTVMRVRLPLA